MKTTMTLNRLKKLVDAEVARGNGRVRVCVDKSSLWDGNGTFEICDLAEAQIMHIPIVDGDGFHETHKDGTEKLRRCFVLSWDYIVSEPTVSKSDKVEEETK
jgi:hypothetical protein